MSKKRVVSCSMDHIAINELITTSYYFGVLDVLRSKVYI